MNKRSVVIIEDDLGDSAKIKASLPEESYNLSFFEDGVDAWSHLEANAKTVDVVIMGKTIPNISGMEILQNMKEHSDLKDVPVIVQTVDTREGKYTKAISKGADFYIAKPLDEKKLGVLVKTAIRTSKQNVASDSSPRSGGGGSFASAIRKQQS